MKSITDLFSKCRQIRSFMRICLDLLKKFLTQRLIYCVLTDNRLVECLKYTLKIFHSNCSYFCRRSRLQVFYKISVFKNFAQSTGKHPVLEFIFNTPATLLKKRLSNMCFPVNFAKFLRTSFL